MALGYLGINCTMIALAYDDEKTPVDLCGKKMLPIFQFDSGETINESLDIIARLNRLNKDEKNLLQMEKLEAPEGLELMESLDQAVGPLFRLVMPHFTWTKEFSPQAREYFQGKKEKTRGSFHQLVQKRSQFEHELVPYLEKVESYIDKFYRSDKLSILDIVLASHLWGLYIVPEFQFTPALHSYLQRIKELCHFDYHGSLWRTGEPPQYPLEDHLSIS